MTSAASPGYQGLFKISTTPLIQVQSCEVTIAGETYDVTVMTGSSSPVWKLFLAGLLSGTVKVVGFWDQVNDAVQATLWSALGTTVAWSFSPNAGTNKYSGNGIITSVPMKFAVNAAETWEVDFQATGAIAYA